MNRTENQARQSGEQEIVPSMSRREALSFLLAGGVLLGTCSSLSAQQNGQRRRRQSPDEGAGNTLSPATASQIDNMIGRFLSSSGAPGVILSVQRGGKTAYEKGYGTINTSQQITPTPETRFQIDSLTKAFTAFSVLRLQDQGVIDIDETVGTYIGTLPNDGWKRIKISELLSMSGGLPDTSSTTQTYKQILEQDAKRQTKYRPGLDFEPGTSVEYSNGDFFLLGVLVDTVSRQKSFATYVRDECLLPLGMENTGLIPFGTGDEYCTPYVKGSATTPRNPLSGYSGGGFTATMADMERFAVGIYERKILKPETYNLMWTPQKLKNGQTTSWGLGWTLVVDSDGKTTRAAKDGGGWGWGSMMIVYPQAGLSLVIFTNVSNTGAFPSLAYSIGNKISTSS